MCLHLRHRRILARRPLQQQQLQLPVIGPRHRSMSFIIDLMLRVITFLLFFTCNASAWTHGLNTTFDPARWGGPSAVSCLGPSIVGTCDTGYNATCAGGATDSAAAYTNFVTANQGVTAV